MNRKFLSNVLLGTVSVQLLCSGNASNALVEGDDVVFPPEIEKMIQEYEKKNKETFLKNIIWLFPFTNPYGPNKEAREELGIYYQQAIPRIYKDPVYSYTKRSEQLTGLAESIDDAEMKKLGDSLSLYYRVRSGEEWMDKNNTNRTVLGRKYGGSDPNFLDGKPYTEMVDEWNSILNSGDYFGLGKLDKADRLAIYNRKFASFNHEMSSVNVYFATHSQFAIPTLVRPFNVSVIK